MSTHEPITTALVIAGITIQQDMSGRYNLNKLHQASPFADDVAKSPFRWARLKSTKALAQELQDQTPDVVIDVVTGGNKAGTYAHELLAISYAGWISPAFQLKVNQAFLDRKRLAPTVPTLHDPVAQALMQVLIDHDATKHRLTLVEAHTRQLEAKVDTAVDNQNFWTIAEYVQYHGLRRQCPESAYVEASNHMRAYCKREKLNFRDPNVLPRRIPVGDKNWETEWGFHTSVYSASVTSILSICARGWSGQNSSTSCPHSLQK